MRKAHTISDSDSDVEISAPLSERLLSGMHPERIQSNSHLLTEKVREKSTLAIAEDYCYIDDINTTSEAFTVLKPVKTRSDSNDAAGKSANCLKQFGKIASEVSGYIIVQQV